MSESRVNDVNYYCLRQGTGSPLVLLHGFTGSSQSWATLTAALAFQMDIVSIDLLGHGLTASPESPARYSMELVAQDVMAIVEYLGLEHIHLLGYSMGGRLALYLADRYPESIKKLVLESTSPGIADAGERDLRRQQDHSLAESIELDGVRNFVDWWEQLPLFASQVEAPSKRKADLRKQRLQNSALGLANSLRGMGTGSQRSLWNSLPSITIPTLLLCGGLDEKYVNIGAQMADSMPKAELQIIPDAGHNIHFERPAKYAAIASSFLEQTG